MSTDILVFGIDEHQFALPLECLVEIVRAVAITPLPAAPAVIEGIIDVRGRIVPVLDLRRRFRKVPRPLDPTQHFVIARAGARVVALRVDGVRNLAHVELGDVERVEDVVPAARYVAGVVRSRDGIVLIHDLADFLSEAESERLDEALSGAGLEGVER